MDHPVSPANSSQEEKGPIHSDEKSNEKTVYSNDVPLYEEDRQDGETSAEEFIETRELRRGLEQRHIQMIALAGAIGTGLFLSSGKALARAGPLGALQVLTMS